MRNDPHLIVRTRERLRRQIRPVPFGHRQRDATGTGTGLEIRLQRAGYVLGLANVVCAVLGTAISVPP